MVSACPKYAAFITVLCKDLERFRKAWRQESEKRTEHIKSIVLLRSVFVNLI